MSDDQLRPIAQAIKSVTAKLLPCCGGDEITSFGRLPFSRVMVEFLQMMGNIPRPITSNQFGMNSDSKRPKISPRLAELDLGAGPRPRDVNHSPIALFAKRVVSRN